MTKSAKRWSLIFFSIALFLTIAIASGLDSLGFSLGMPFPEAEVQGSTLVVQQKDSRLDLPVNRIIGLAFLVPIAATILYAAIRMVMGMDWKGLRLYLAKAISAVAGIVALVFLVFRSFPRGSPRSKDSFLIPPPPPRFAKTSPLGAPPGILVWLAAIAVAALALALAWRLLARKGEPGDAPSPIGMAAGEARQALLEGRDFKDTITRCYRRMSREMEIDRGIERMASMTAREFEELLARGGIPIESVHRLTLLFEKVRYGDFEPTSADEAEAVACLDAIEAYSRESGGKP